MEKTKSTVKPFMISTADSKYAKYLLQALIEENASKGWKETLYKDKGDLKWVPSQIEDNDRITISITVSSCNV
jgi:hypothetical protein